jgi:hypothetical protein
MLIDFYQSRALTTQDRAHMLCIVKRYTSIKQTILSFNSFPYIEHDRDGMFESYKKWYYLYFHGWTHGPQYDIERSGQRVIDRVKIRQPSVSPRRWHFSLTKYLY